MLKPTTKALVWISVFVVPRGDHDLRKDYVGPLLDQWLVG